MLTKTIEERKEICSLHTDMEDCDSCVLDETEDCLCNDCNASYTACQDCKSASQFKPIDGVN